MGGGARRAGAVRASARAGPPWRPGTPLPLSAHNASRACSATAWRSTSSKRLLEGVDPEPLLKGYRQRPGQQTWIGEHIGKFIDAATNAWAYDRRRAAEGEARSRGQRPAGDAARRRLSRHIPRTRPLQGLRRRRVRAIREQPLWDVWAHKYNLLALLNYYQRTGFEPALAAARRIGDLLCRTYGDGRQEHRPQRLARRHGQHQRARADGDALPSHRRRPLSRVLPLHRARLGRALGSEDPHHAPDEGARERGRQRQGVRDDVELRRPARAVSRDRRGELSAGRAARLGRHRQEPPLSDRHGKLGRALSRRPPAARRRPGRRGLRDDDLDAGQPEAAGADRRGEVRRRAGADHLQRAHGRAAPRGGPHLLLHAARRHQAVRDGQPGRARRELLHVERAARPDAHPVSRVGRPQRNGVAVNLFVPGPARLTLAGRRCVACGRRRGIRWTAT